MVDSAATPDYYAILQVHPSADQEVIEAAFRQLMKKHHPDVAGRDARLSAEYHQRAKVINQAHTVLRDPEQRRRYDSLGNLGEVPPAWAPPGSSEFQDPPTARVASNPQRGAGWTSSRQPSEWVEAEQTLVSPALSGPIAALSALYYLLPGPYEWERGHGQKFLTTCLIPPVGIAAFALATGRLAPLVGTSLSQTLLACGVLLLLLLPSWSSLPRLAMASAASVVLLSGVLDPILRQTSTPAWLAWVVLGLLSLLLSARLYVFAVVPTLAACWLLTRLG